MDYYYDILLNFGENYCMFYEWDKDDDIEFIKKIPIIHVEQKTLQNILLNKIKVTKEFLETIENKTKLKDNNTLKYTTIFSDGKNSVAVEFAEDGISINKSSLILEDELNINEFMYNINLTKLEFTIIAKEQIIKETRQDIKVKRLLQLEINKMYNDKEYSKLKYIYLEWFNELKDNIDIMYQDMLNKLKENLTIKEYNIYELIRLSYNNV